MALGRAASTQAPAPLRAFRHPPLLVVPARPPEPATVTTVGARVEVLVSTNLATSPQLSAQPSVTLAPHVRAHSEVLPIMWPLVMS